MINMLINRKIFVNVTKGLFFLALLNILFTNCIKVQEFEENVTISVSTNSLRFSSAGGQQDFSISTYRIWTVSKDVEWLNVDPSSGNPEDGSDVGRVWVYVDANSNTISRTATITVSSRIPGVPEQIINVLQDAYTTPRRSVFGNGVVAASNYESGNGTQGSPYLIQDEKQLKKFVVDVNNGYGFSDNYFMLMTDIQVTTDVWTPIGDNDIREFQGNFDGNGHSISGTLQSLYPESDFGFFGRTGENSRISNLTIEASVIRDGFIQTSTGGVAGISKGEIINCTVLASASISGSNYCVGGIVGANVGVIRNCTNNATISGESASTGGIAGQNVGIINNCLNNGTVSLINFEGLLPFVRVGGITGYNFSNGIITNCINNVAVSGIHADTGGLAGWNIGVINNCTNNGIVSILESQGYYYNVGGIAGVNYEGMITNCTNNAAVNVNDNGCGGGITGHNYGTIHTSLNTGNISGSICLGGLTGSNFDYTSYTSHIYSCCTNQGTINGATANKKNQIYEGRDVETCMENHTKR